MSGNTEMFSMGLWVKGFVGSACNLLGFSFFILAIDTRKEIDLIFAWNLAQNILVLVVTSVLSWHLPDWMQLFGFLLGFMGSLTLVVPDLMSRLWITVTCQAG